MNEAEAGKQIDQMVRFIKQEAEEKANEISISAEEEFNIAKLQLLESEKQKIRKDYERRLGQITVKQKIEQSKQLNETRLKILQARENVLSSLVKEAESKLLETTADPDAYAGLLKDLLVQALDKLSESPCVIRCREVDRDIVVGVLGDAMDAYSETFGKGGIDAIVDEANFLPKPPTGTREDDERETCLGGIVVASANGRIVCSNTIDDRLRIAHSQTLPSVRADLFGAVVAVRN